MNNARAPHFSTMSRRRFLGLGAGALSVYGLTSTGHSTPASPGFFEPEVRSSVSGFLTTRLRASTMQTVVRGQNVLASVYEGTFPGPTLRVRPGDFVRIDLVNDLAEATNLHLHGLHISPESPGDNVLLHIPPGGQFTYEFVIPDNHPGGTYFYHPHMHELVTNQVFKGMAGLLIIEGDIDAVPGIAGVPELSMVLMRTVITNGAIPTLRPNGGVGTGTVLVNGAQNQTIFIRPGETQRWRLVNATVSSHWKIQVEGHQVTLIAQDGNTLANAVTTDSIKLATGQRRELLIQGGQPGVYQITFQDEIGFGSKQPQVFATLHVTGPAVNPQPLPTTLIPFPDLRSLPIDRARTLAFGMAGPTGAQTFGGQGFVIDGLPFDETRVDQFVNLGETEEWTILNPTFSPHPFHIHINPFQITRIDGQPVNALSYEDTTVVAPNGGSITFLTRFLDFAGTWVYHCHILGHEDGGMMGIVQAAARGLPVGPGTRPTGPEFRPTGPGFRPTGPGRP
jgi:FtsP/CotA-like multicopper oxidase with cupredoxin domain